MLLMGRDEVSIIMAVGIFASVMFLLCWARFAVRERLMAQAARTKSGVKIGEHYYYLVEFDEYVELITGYKTDPDRIEQYQVEAALAWLKRMGAGFYSQQDGELGHISSADLVKTVLKAVREAQR